MCFNTVEWNAAEVERHMQIVGNSASNAQAIEDSKFYLSQCVERLSLHPNPVKEAINDEIRMELDTIYIEKLGKGDIWKYFGTSSSTWIDPYEEYSENVVSKLEDIYSAMVSDDRIENVTDNVKIALKNCASKAKLVLKVQDIHMYPESVPFMSSSVWVSLSQQLKRIPKSLLEVRLYCMRPSTCQTTDIPTLSHSRRYRRRCDTICRPPHRALPRSPFVRDLGRPHSASRICTIHLSYALQISAWYSPLVYNHKIVGGTWKIGSATAEIVRALYGHPDIKADHVHDAFNAVSVYPEHR